MRARTAALVPALVAVSLVGAGCGGDDEPAATPTPAAATSAPQSTTAQGGTSPDATPPTTAPGGVTAKDSLSTQIAKSPDLRTLRTLLNAAGMASVLDDGRYTVFAPNNDAFTKLGTQLDTLLQPGAKAQLQNLLKFHIVRGKIRAKRLTDGRLLTTLQGTRLRVTAQGNQLIVGNSLGKATILTPDARASNGIIHTVDTVLRPKS
jgi:uncharacterized surface protein with fasciclin (FAS1) repeats